MKQAALMQDNATVHRVIMTSLSLTKEELEVADNCVEEAELHEEGLQVRVGRVSAMGVALIGIRNLIARSITKKGLIAGR